MRTANRCTLLLAALFLSAPAFADGIVQMVINGKSRHVGAQYDWNENNYGLGVEYQFGGQSRWIKTAMVDAFIDSRDKMSYLVGGGLHRRLIASDRLGGMYFDAGIGAFLMSRKDVRHYRPFFGALPSVTLGNHYGGLNLSYVPGRALRDFAHVQNTDPGVHGVWFLQLKLRLDKLLPH